MFGMFRESGIVERKGGKKNGSWVNKNIFYNKSDAKTKVKKVKISLTFPQLRTSTGSSLCANSPHPYKTKRMHHKGTSSLIGADDGI